MAGRLLAALALLLAALIAMRLGSDPNARLVVCSAIVLGGGLQIFARYAEYYAFPFAAGLLLVWSALRWLDRGGPLLAVTVSYVVAGLCHAVFLFVAPAMFYLAWLAWTRGERRSLLLALVGAPVVGVGLLMLFHYPFGEILKESTRSGMFLPPLGTWTERTAYSAFAPAHLAELLDLVLLISPSLLVLVPFAMCVKGRWSETQRFAALLAPGPLFFVFFAHAELGTVRDWDFYVVPITLITLAVAVRVVTPAAVPIAAPDPGQLATPDPLPGRLGLALLVTGLVTAGAWMQSNHDPPQARARLERTGGNPALYGPMSRGELWRYLSAACVDGGDVAGAVRNCVHAIESEPDDRQNYRFLASIRMDEARASGRDADSAVRQCIRDLAGRKHREECLYSGVALATSMAGRGDLALWAAHKAVAEDSRSVEAAAMLGDVLRRSGRFVEAHQAYESALALNPDIPRARVGLAALAGVAGDAVALRALAAEALKRTPWSPLAQEFQRAIDTGVRGAEAFQNFLHFC